jgi:methionine aminopeptidase
VTAGCRMIKSEHELELMKIANAATLAVYEAVFRALTPGMTAQQASGLVNSAYGKVGFRGEASFEVGAASSLPHGSVAPQVIREGTPVIVDDGCTVEGYQSDISRTFVLGKASDRAKKVFDIVHRAQRAALEAARPGVACQAVDAAARKVIEDAGFGPDYRFFSHRVGHGIGMDGHEWPYLVRGNQLALAPGMTFSDEPGVYIAGEFGVRLEDDMHITPDGAKLFTGQSPDIEKPFGWWTKRRPETTGPPPAPSRALSIAGTSEAIIVDRPVISAFPTFATLVFTPFVCTPIAAIIMAFIAPVIVTISRLRDGGSENRHTASQNHRQSTNPFEHVSLLLGLVESLFIFWLSSFIDADGRREGWPQWGWMWMKKCLLPALSRDAISHQIVGDWGRKLNHISGSSRWIEL